MIRDDSHRQRIKKAVNVFLILLICLWFVPFYNKGIDFTDTCFYLAKYKYYFDLPVPVSGIGTYFSDLLGSILYHVFTTHQLLWLNIASAVCYTAGGFFIYYVLRDFVPHTLLLVVTLGSSLYTLSYIHCFNYNTTSMFHLSLAILLLSVGLFQDKYRYIAGSGFVSALNIFFRIPNILHMCIVFGAFLYSYDKNGHKWKDAIKPTLTYIAGCLTGGITGCVVSVVTLGGVESLISYAKNVFLKLTGTEDTHSTSSMLSNLASQITNGVDLWKQYALWLLLMIGISFVLCCFMRKWQKIILICAGTASMAYGFWVKFSLGKVSTEESASNTNIRNTFCFLLLTVMVLSFIGIFVFFKSKREFSYLCLITFFLEFVITIGTDTGALYNIVFLYLPTGMLCCLLYQYHLLLKDTKWWSELATSAGIVIMSFSIMLLFYSGYYRATTYVYRDSSYSELTELCDITPLEGMYTSPERAELIRLIQEQLEPYGGYSIITFGDCNIASVVSDLTPYFTIAWPDLSSFSEESYQQQLLQCEETGDYPVILFSTTTMRTYTGRLEGKEQMLLDLIENHDYELIYEDDSLTIYVPAGA